MLADVVDVDTARSGGRRAGTYFAILGLTEKLAVACIGLAMSSGVNIGSNMIVIGTGWLLIGPVLWLTFHLGAPYGSPSTQDISEGLADALLVERVFMAWGAVVTSVLPGLTVAGIGFWLRNRGRSTEDER